MVTDSVQVQIYMRLRGVVDAVLGVLPVIAALAVVGITEAAVSIVRVRVVRARRAGVAAGVRRMEAGAVVRAAGVTGVGTLAAGTPRQRSWRPRSRSCAGRGRDLRGGRRCRASLRPGRLARRRSSGHG